MSSRKVAPYGSWRSPITSDVIIAESIGIGEIRLDGDDIYWTEMRPSEGGRNVVVRRGPDGATADVTPPFFNVRTLVHEYGGGAFIVSNGVVYFSNFEDQRLYRQRQGEEPEPITPEAAVRYADGVMDSKRSRIICVREDHRGEGEAVTTIVSIGLDGMDSGSVLLSGHDFYASPRLSAGWVAAGLALVGSSKHAVGRQRLVGCRGKGGRLSWGCAESGRRRRRSHQPA